MISDIQKDYDDALKNMSEKRLAILQMQSQGIDNEEIGNRLGMSVDSFLSAYNELTKVEEKAKEVKNTDLSVEKMFGNTDDINKINEQIRTTKEIIGDLGDDALDDLLNGDSYEANVEESNLDYENLTDNKTHVASLPHLIHSLDENNRADMQKLVDSGWASIKCS